jgi:hypothetical protein
VTQSPPRTKTSTRKRSSSSGPRSRGGDAAPPGRPRLREAARHVILPASISTGEFKTGFSAVRETCLRIGITFEPWQEGAGKAILGKRPDGLYAADAVALSIPRQVGKTYLVGALVVALSIITPRTLTVWTAHHGATAADTFRDLKAIVEHPQCKPYIRAVYDSGARLEIIFTNGSRIVFGARESGFGRGFKRVGILVFDEAQILTSKTVEDIVPTTNRHPNPLIFYMGTPPKPSDPSDHFQALRHEAIEGESSDTFYLEFSADPGCDPMDREQWAKANPSFPHLTTARAMMRMRKNLKGPGAFEREALGIWDGTASSGVFAAGAWGRCGWKPDGDGNYPAPPPVRMLGIAADIDQTWLSLGVFCEDESEAHVGSNLRRRFTTGRQEFLAEVKRICTEHDVPVAIDAHWKDAKDGAPVPAGGPACSLLPELEDLGVTIVRTGLDDFIQACADLVKAVELGTVSHGNYADLDDAVDAATWRKVGDRRVFARKNGDISMLEAVAIAKWAAGNGVDSVYEERGLVSL